MLLFDLTTCQSNRATLNHGAKEYAETVLNQMMAQDVPLAGIFDSTRLIDSKYLEYCQAHGGLVDIHKQSLQACIASKKYTVFYSANPESYSDIHWQDVQFIGTIHGLRYVEVVSDHFECAYAKDLFHFIKSKMNAFAWKEPKKQKKALAKIAKVVSNPSFVCLTPSEHTKYSLLYHFPTLNPNNIHVFYAPLRITDTENTTRAGNSIPDKYYLFVSGNRWIKNTYRGIRAIDDLISAGRFNSKVIVTGVPHSMHYIPTLRNKEYFTFKGYVPSEELAILYKRAYCFVFLSLSEGFGYSPLEAIARGVPVICSPYTALPEIFQAGVMYCNPTSNVDIKVKILSMENRKIHEKYKQQGMERAVSIMRRQKEDLPKLVDFILSHVKRNS